MKGDIIELFEDGHQYGARDLLVHVVLKVPGAAIADYEYLKDAWMTAIDWEVVDRDVGLDAWQLRIY